MNIPTKKHNIIRSWLSRDLERGYVTRTADGRYKVGNVAAIGRAIERIERNSATGGTTKGSTPPRKPAQLCRLHNVEFNSVMAYNLKADFDDLYATLIDWRMNRSPGVVHWHKSGIVEGMKARARFHIALGPRRCSIQFWVQPIFVNSFKLFEMLDAVHTAAQQTLSWLSKNYKLEFGMLEARKAKHFAIRIPIKEGWRLGTLGYGMRNGKVWVNEDWWIDESYGQELETANQTAFKELVETPAQVKAMRDELNTKLDEIHGSIKELKPKAPQPPPPPEDPVEVA